jgi:ribosomal protein S18 acetylase RimI-like enzyme
VIEIVEELPSKEVLAEFSKIPIAYRVDAVSRPNYAGVWSLMEEAIKHPYIKNYDDVDSPHAWPNVFNMSNWTIFSAFDKGGRVGGTVLAWNTPGVDMLEGRSDLVVMWNLRIHPDYRRQHIGSLLFAKAVEWGRMKGCRELKVETQDINVRACKFYGAMGCELRVVRPNAYPSLPDEVQFLWYRAL